jgi:hypothetical protein
MLMVVVNRDGDAHEHAGDTNSDHTTSELSRDVTHHICKPKMTSLRPPDLEPSGPHDGPQLPSNQGAHDVRPPGLPGWPGVHGLLPLRSVPTRAFLALQRPWCEQDLGCA